MSAEVRNFRNYQLGDNVHQLAEGLLPEMAETMGYELTDQPDVDNLRGLIGHIGPAKWLQDNIALVRERLGTAEDAQVVAAGWTERSGVMIPMTRSFVSPEIAVPDEVDSAVITGGVARWMLRRADRLERVTARGMRVGRVVIAAGSRQMRPSEHARVADYAILNGAEPTEADFARTYMVPALAEAGHETELVAVDSSDGDDVMRAAAEATRGGTVLAVGNAPAAIQVAGQYRLAAREASAGFDTSGDQLFMTADTLPVARGSEGPATHQNPFTALGQIARSALFLRMNQD